MSWDVLLGNLCTWVGGEKALFLSGTSDGRYSGTSCYNFDFGNVVAKYNNGFNSQDPRLPYSKRMTAGQSDTSQNLIPNGLLVDTEYFNEIYVPSNICDSLHSVLADNRQLGRQAISIYRGFGTDFFQTHEIERMKGIQPYIMQALEYAVWISALPRDRTEGQLCSTLLSENLRFRPIKGKLSETLDECVSLSLAGDQLIPRTDAIRDVFGIAFQKARRGLSTRMKLAVSHHDFGHKSDFIELTFRRVPMNISWMDPDDTSVMLCASRIEQDKSGDNHQLFATAFSLSPAETRLLGDLLRDSDLRKASANLGIKYETARWHLKNMLHKTRYARRYDLVHAARNLDLSNLS